MRIKIDPADKYFSWYIRLRDMKCMRCGSAVEINAAGLPNSHQASHYFGRGKEATRFDPENVDCLCGACHRIWGSDERESYRNFKLQQLGQQGFDALTVRAYNYKKRDRAMALLEAKALLQSVSN